MIKKRIFPLILLLTTCLLAISNIYFYKKNQKLEKSNVVDRVVDGDTFLLKSGERMRLGNVEAPELEFCGGEQAKRRLEELIQGKKVDLDIFTYDNFNRPVALVYQKGTLINEILLEEGLARYDGTPNSKRDLLKKAYNYASENKKGIFGPPCFSVKPDNPKCYIKGNLDRHSKQKTYHFPGCSGYAQVMVEKDLGEDWFCSEKEAEAAGFRKSTNCYGKKFLAQ